MNRSNIHKKIDFILMSLIIMSMPYHILLNSACILLFALHWLIQGELKSKWNQLKNPLTMLWVILFVLHVFSAYKSLNQDEALAILVRRLSMLAMPILLVGNIEKTQLNKLLAIFIGSIFSALLYCLLIAAYRYNIDHQSIHFFYHPFSAPIGMNAVYLAAYVLFGINITIMLVFEEREWSMGIGLSVLAFFFICLLLLSSKMMMLVLLIQLFVWVLVLVRSKKQQLISGLIILLAILLSVFFSTSIKQRFKQELDSNFNIVKQDRYDGRTPFTGSTLRITIWKFCVQILQENKAWFTGVGIGDMQQLLDQKYINSGMYIGNPKLKDIGYRGYDAHDEYIEILLCTGIMGLSVFILLLVLLVVHALKAGNYLLLQLLILAFMFFISESVLSNNKGIVFFIFFICLLCKKNAVREN